MTHEMLFEKRESIGVSAKRGRRGLIEEEN
jgi:hypothetical protein